VPTKKSSRGATLRFSFEYKPANIYEQGLTLVVEPLVPRLLFTDSIERRPWGSAQSSFKTDGKPESGAKSFLFRVLFFRNSAKKPLFRHLFASREQLYSCSVSGRLGLRSLKNSSSDQHSEISRNGTENRVKNGFDSLMTALLN
jgi:hypothetical protein